MKHRCQGEGRSRGAGGWRGGARGLRGFCGFVLHTQRGASLLMNELQTTSSLRQRHCLTEEHIPGPVVCHGASGLFVSGVSKCCKGEFENNESYHCV